VKTLVTPFLMYTDFVYLKGNAMKSLVLLVLLTAFVFAIPVYAQTDTRTYTGHNFTLEYPETWYLEDEDNGIRLTNEPPGAFSGLFVIEPGLITVAITLEPHPLYRFEENDPIFAIGYFTGMFAGIILYNNIDQDIEEIRVREIDQVQVGDEVVLTTRVEIVPAVEMIVFKADGPVALTATTPYGEMDQYVDTLTDIVRSIKYQPED
jgi:hypothetical protein